MFARLSITLTALALIAAAPLVAGEKEIQRVESLQKFRSLCETLLSQSTDPSAKKHAARFLELSKLRSWANKSGKTIHATYLGHGRNDQNDAIIHLEMNGGSQYRVKPNILAKKSQQEARELELLVSAIAGDASRFYAQTQPQAHSGSHQQDAHASAPVTTSTTYAADFPETPVYTRPVRRTTIVLGSYQPYPYWSGGYTACPYNPWAAGPFSTMGPFTFR